MKVSRFNLRTCGDCSDFSDRCAKFVFYAIEFNTGKVVYITKKQF